MPDLSSLVQSLTPPLALAGIAVSKGGQRSFHLTAPGFAVTERTLFRSASISKIVVGWTARLALAKQTGGRAAKPEDQTVESLLGIPLRHPLAPDQPITVGQIAAHCAGLTDAAGYALPVGQSLADWIVEQGPAIWSDHPPGTYFDYCNLGYILLAAVAEQASGQRFDQLARGLVFDPLDIEGGFNWSGVMSERRMDRIPTYRETSGQFHPNIDDKVASGGISGNDGNQITADYRLGADTSRLSPQGGLRISLSGMLKLSEALTKGPQTRIWSPDIGPGAYYGGLFESYGWGLQFLDNPPFYPRPLIGHCGNAYGFRGGVWHDAAAGLSFAYALNGFPETDDSDDLHEYEAAVFDALANQVA